ncbi:hypothetical protein COOONC_00462 [Cooperia oncophora]
MMEMEPTDIMELDLAHPNQHEVTLQQLANLKLAAKLLHDENEADLDLVIKQVITGGQNNCAELKGAHFSKTSPNCYSIAQG